VDEMKEKAESILEKADRVNKGLQEKANEANRMIFIYEDLQSRNEIDRKRMRIEFEKENKRLIKEKNVLSAFLVTIIILIVCFSLYVFAKYDVVVANFSQEGNGLNNINRNGEQGDINYESEDAGNNDK